MTLLVVEDNRADAELLREALIDRQTSVDLYVVWTAADAIAFLAKTGAFEHSPDPDLVLIDLNLPRADGRDILRQARALTGCERLPMIVYSGANNPADMDECMALGASEYLVKPHGAYTYDDMARDILRIAGATA
jgi:two-component system, chemotaxis family, response regulator Rcp1